MVGPSQKLTMGKELFENIVKAIRRAQRIVIFTHINPDGDALGSAWALQQTLSNKQVVIISNNRPAKLFYEILQNLSFEKVSPFQPDLVMILDCSELGRVNMGEILRLPPFKKIPWIVIDHHQNGNLEKSTKYSWKDTTSSSTAEMVWRLITRLEIKPSANIATGLLLGIYTDTGGFRHANTSGETLIAVSELLALGGNLLKISQALSPRQSLPKVRLWGGALSEIFLNRFKMAVAVVREKDLRRFGASVEDAAGLVNIILQLRGARAAAVFLETKDGWRVSLRTRQKSSISSIAKLFGGRGRDRFAGFLATKSQIRGKIN